MGSRYICWALKTGQSSNTWFMDWQYVQTGFGIGLRLTWLTRIGSFVSKSFILLDRLAILTSVAVGDSMKWLPPFEEIGLVFLDFSWVGSHWMVFSVRSSNKSHPWFSSFCKNPLWYIVSKRILIYSLNCHKEFGTIATSLCHDEDIRQGDLWNAQSTSKTSY